MSSRGDREFLEDIAEAIRRATEYSHDLRYDDFVADLKTQDAVLRTLEVIGEATKRLSETMRRQNPGVPWKNMAGVRDKLVHDYFGVNLDIVWQIVHEELPEVATNIEQILATLQE